MKMMGISDRSAAIRSCRTKPLRSGSDTSSSRQLGTTARGWREIPGGGAWLGLPACRLNQHLERFAHRDVVVDHEDAGLVAELRAVVECVASNAANVAMSALLAVPTIREQRESLPGSTRSRIPRRSYCAAPGCGRRIRYPKGLSTQLGNGCCKSVGGHRRVRERQVLMPSADHRANTRASGGQLLQ